MALEPIDRLEAKIDKSDNCWLWAGAIDKAGYGRMGVGGKVLYTHRLSYEFYVGPIPEGLHIDHICRVRSCLNPDHLEPVTCRENARRGNTGELSGAKQRAKTHCPQGHPYDETNTYVDPNNGSRTCRKCHAERERRSQVKRRAAMSFTAGLKERERA